MIIECPSCRARFRLDEARIKGRGARVRCRRCGDSIVVLKPTGQEIREDALDLRSVVKGSLESEAPGGTEKEAGSPKAVPPPREPRAPAPQPPAPLTPVFENGEPAQEPRIPDAQPTGVQPPGKDEIDLAFDRILGSEREEESGKPFDLAVDFRPEEKVDLRPPVESGGKDIPLETGRSDFLASDSDTLELLKKEFDKEDPGGGKRETLDISGHLRSESEVSASPPEILQTSFPQEESLPRAEDQPSITSPDFETQLKEASERAEEALPQPAPPPEPPKEKAPPQPQRERRAEPAPRVRSPLLILVLLFLVLAVGGGYLGFTSGGQELLRRMYPGVESLLRGGKSGPQFDVRNLIGYYEPNAHVGKLFIIKGQVTNVGRARKSSIKIQAALLDDKDQPLMETVCYAGNVLPGDVLRKAPRKEIEEVLSNRFGERLINMEVQPGKSVPFMVVFFNAPAEIGAYRLEAMEE